MIHIPFLKKRNGSAPKSDGAEHVTRMFVYMVTFSLFLGITLYLFPVILTMKVEQPHVKTAGIPETFPVTVDPQKKIIVENPEVNALFDTIHTPLQAAVNGAADVAEQVFEWVALSVSATPWYQDLAAADARLVSIKSGMRKEQIASVLTSALGWSADQKNEFLAATTDKTISEGTYSPGIYALAPGSTPQDALTSIRNRFYEDILSHYSTTTEAVVPIKDALTIASLIEREAGGADDMRLISGVIWNRLFINMPLQVDATLQYVKASSKNSVANWWPVVVPADRFRKSPYNTYLNAGLPPGPIANPSVASVLAALNPRNTTCLFYFHDSAKRFHCSDTYAEHVALLKKYYGRGK